MSGSLFIQNRQRAVPIDAPSLRRFIGILLRNLLARKHFDLGLYLVRSPEMARLNEKFLRHEGSTDVITFDYGFGVPSRPGGMELQTQPLHGEIFVCVDEAVSQARRYRTNWPRELARYIVHAVLHLSGYDDSRPSDRLKMKREEDRLLRQLNRRCAISALAGRQPATRRASIKNRKS